MDGEIEAYFPDLINTLQVKHQAMNLIKRCYLLLDFINDVEGALEEIKELDNSMLLANKVKNYAVLEVSMNKKNEECYILLAKHLNLSHDRMTALQYYQSFELLNKEKK